MSFPQHDAHDILHSIFALPRFPCGMHPLASWHLSWELLISVSHSSGPLERNRRGHQLRPKDSFWYGSEGGCLTCLSRFGIRVKSSAHENLRRGRTKALDEPSFIISPEKPQCHNLKINTHTHRESGGMKLHKFVEVPNTYVGNIQTSVSSSFGRHHTLITLKGTVTGSHFWPTCHFKGQMSKT